IKDDDLVIGTHGRSFWILDNITPLRWLSERLNVVKLYPAQNAFRVRWTMYTDTPVPQEEPAGENPPDGAMIDYYLPEKAKTVTLKIFTGPTVYGEGTTVQWLPFTIREYSSNDTLYKVGEVNIPHYWIRTQQILSAEPGHHRFLWDMKYAPLNIPPSYPISANYMNTAPDQTAPWVMPGNYIAILTADGISDTTMFTIKMDPRVKTSLPNRKLQHDLSLQCYNGRKECMKVLEEIRSYLSMLHSQLTNAAPAVADELNKKDKLARELENTPQGSTEPSFGRLNSGFASVFGALQDSDMQPTTQMINAVKELNQQMIVLKKKWAELKK